MVIPLGIASLQSLRTLAKHFARDKIDNVSTVEEMNSDGNGRA